MKSKGENESLASTRREFSLNLFTKEQLRRDSGYKKAQVRLLLNRQFYERSRQGEEYQPLCKLARGSSVQKKTTKKSNKCNWLNPLPNNTLRHWPFLP